MTTTGDLAPIALIAFKRPMTTLQTLYTLSRCPEAERSELFVFCDGPRNEGERRDVELTREVIRSHKWCGRVEIVEAEQNRGLARSVIAAVTRLCDSHGRVIVLEDDLLVSRGFLAYMNEALRRYAEEERVMQVSGHCFDIDPQAPRPFFLPLVTTWGWGTWKRAWARFQERPLDVERLQDRAYRRAFDADGSYVFSGMLEAQLAGRVDSWGIRWMWSVFHHQGRVLFPGRTLVKNIGAGEGATHTHSGMDLSSLTSRTFGLDNEARPFPDRVEIDQAAYEAWKRYLNRTLPRPRLRTRARQLVRDAIAELRRASAKVR